MAAARKISDPSRFAIFPVAVSAVQQISEHYLRISLTGPALHAFAGPVNAGQGFMHDAYIKLLIPPPGETNPTDIELNEDWRSQWFCRPEHERGWMRTYTLRAVRRIEAATAPQVTASLRTSTMLCSHIPLPTDLPSWQPEVDIDFVLHKDAQGEMGPGSAWAAQAQVGDMISFFGPLEPEPLWTTWDPEHANRAVICVDETGVPAALSIASSLPEDVTTDILLEVPSEADIPDDRATLINDEVLNRHSVNIHWLARTVQAERGQKLCSQLRLILDVQRKHIAPQEPDAEGMWPVLWSVAEDIGDTYVFLAGESSVVRSLRRICVNEAGIDKKSVSFMGYWKEGRAEG